MKQRVILYAEDDKVLTDGEHFGKILYLAECASPDDYYEISQAEYDKILKEKNIPTLD